MRKNLLVCLAAAGMLFASVETKAQGQSCESATPIGMMLMVTPAMYPDGAWVKTTQPEASLLNISLSPGYTGNATDIIKVYKGCTSEEAITISADNTTGALQFYLEGEVEYTIKVNTENQVLPIVGMTSFLLMSSTPPGATCMNPIPAMLGMFYNQEANSTLWYKITFPWSNPINVSDPGFPTPSGAVIRAIIKHLDCNAVANEDTEMMPGYLHAKSGENLVRVTTDIATQISIGMVSPPSFTCGNKPERISPLVLDTATPFANAVFDNYWTFIPEETGTYTISNKAPEGTILKVGILAETLENDKLVFSCDFDSKPISTTIEDGNETLNVELEAGKTYIICSDLYSKFATAGERPSIQIAKSSGSSISSATKESKDLIITPNPSDGKFAVKSYLLKEGANVNVYDMAGNAIYRATVAPTDSEFPVQLNNVQTGTYLVLVIGKSKSASAKITIE